MIWVDLSHNMGLVIQSNWNTAKKLEGLSSVLTPVCSIDCCPSPSVTQTGGEGRSPMDTANPREVATVNANTLKNSAFTSKACFVYVPHEWGKLLIQLHPLSLLFAGRACYFAVTVRSFTWLRPPNGVSFIPQAVPFRVLPHSESCFISWWSNSLFASKIL